MIKSQDEFNKSVARMLRDLYSVVVISPSTIAAGEPDALGIRDRSDEAFRRDLADIDAYAFRSEYADMPAPVQPFAD